MKFLLHLALVALTLGLLASNSVLAATPRLTEAAGIVTGFDEDSLLLSVNTRLGPRRFQLSAETLILLNNHSADFDDILFEDEVVVTYRFDTSEASTVHLFREARRRGRVSSVSATVIGVRLQRGAVLQLRPNANSRIEMAGIPISNNQILLGRTATVIYEPGTLVLLSLAGETQSVQGRLSAVDATARTITIGGRRPQVFTLHTSATIRRNGRAAAVTDVRAGDRVKIAFARSGSGRQALAVRAVGAAD